jgi:hypothetical protein
VTTITSSLTLDTSTIDDSAVTLDESTITTSLTLDQSRIIESGTGQSPPGGGKGGVEPTI